MVKSKGDDTMTNVGLNLISLKSEWVFQNSELRLNASAYSSESIKARTLIENLCKKFRIDYIKNLSEKVFAGERTKFLFTTSKDGIPYLTPTDLFMFHLKPRKWIKTKTKNIENFKADPFTILITQSGTPGRCLLVNNLFKNMVISPDVIRIVLNDEGRKVVGYIYAFLNTWIGQAILTSHQYGATVNHIEPYHVGDIPIPRIPDLEEKINQKILKAHELREEAQKCILKSEEMIYSKLGLPKIDEDNNQYLSKRIKAFKVKASELDFRLDANYHMPIARIAVSILSSSSSGKVKKLKEVIAHSFVPPRFKRNYVKDPNNGVPFLQGAHISQIKPLDIKYINKNMKKLETYLIKENWILITRSGTVGQIALVSNHWNNWMASDHIIRIIPDKEKINPGYLVGFLLSVYGQIQFKCIVYGGVVDEIGEAGELYKHVLILKPNNKDIEDEIGSLVVEAYNKRDEANKIEMEAINELETCLIKVVA